RSGDDSGEVFVVWRGCQRHVGVAFHQDFSGPWHCLRYRRKRTGGTCEHGSRNQTRGRAIHPGGRELPLGGSLRGTTLTWTITLLTKLKTGACWWRTTTRLSCA